MCLSTLQTTPIGKARVIYEKLVQYFPTLGKYWKLWAEHEVVFPPISHNNRILLCMRYCRWMLLFAVIMFNAGVEMGMLEGRMREGATSVSLVVE